MSINDRMFQKTMGFGSLNDKLYNNYNGGLSFVESGSVASPLSVLSNITSGLFTPVLSFPANILKDGSNLVYVDAFIRKIGGNGGWVPFLNFGFGAGRETLNWTLSATDNTFFRLSTCFTVSLGTVTGGYLSPGASGAGAIVDYTGDIDNSKDQTLQFGVRNGNIADSYELIAYSVFVNN